MPSRVPLVTHESSMLRITLLRAEDAGHTTCCDRVPFNKDSYLCDRSACLFLQLHRTHIKAQSFTPSAPCVAKAAQKRTTMQPAAALDTG
jgi:hypothetical protein